ncbi:DUF4394 domain-containing protein [Nocardioides sp.]|uniref:DUF4394 domain-containing protein n=1 Tax=Nocardioides sp. TaxID=35761 RepID=UPI002ED4A545
MRQRNTTIAAVGVAGLALAAGVLSGPATAGDTDGRSLRAIGLVGDTKLVSFDVDRPQKTRAVGQVRGLVGDTALVGIDYRVQDSKLYGVGDSGGVYTINPRTARATRVSQLTVALDGTTFGVDFNPAADRLRVTSDTGQNLRHDVNPAGVTVADVTLSYPPTAPPATGINGSAYTNNDLDPATATTLFAIDTLMDQVAVQAPANNGTLSATGKLGVDARRDVGFDIVSRVDGGSTIKNTAYASITTGGRAAFYKVQLLTGRVSPVGSFPRSHHVRDIALPIDS